jgi:hypothetical protein
MWTKCWIISKMWTKCSIISKMRLLLINTGEYKYWIVVNKCLIINKEHFKSWILGKKLLVFMKVDLEWKWYKIMQNCWL